MTFAPPRRSEPPVADASDAAMDPRALGAMRVAGLAMAVVLAIELVVLAWAARRGIDVTDEGLYHLHYAHPGSDPYFPSQYDMLVGLGFGPFRPPVLLLRLLRLTLEIGTSALLAFGAARFVRAWLPRLAPFAPWWILGLAASVFALASHVWMPETPAYNTFTAALVSTVLALVLVVGSGRTSTRSSPLIATAVGVALAVLLFVKWPSAVLMTIVVVTLWLALRGFAAGMVALGWSVLGGILILATTVGPVGGFDLGALRRANTASVGSGSSVPSDRFELYLTSVADGVGGLVSGWTVAALVAFVGLFVLSQLAAPRAIAVAAASVAIVGVTFGLVTQLRAGPPASVTELRGEDSLLGAVISPSMLLIPVVGAGSGLLVLAGRRLLARMRARSAGPSGLHEPRRWVPVLAVLGALAVAPAIVSIGTTNPLLSHVLVGAAPLGVLLVIAVATLVAGAPRGAGLAGVGLVLAALLVATQTVNGRIFDPYRGTTTLAGQTAGLSGVAGYEGILVDPEVAQFVDELRSVVRTRTDYEPGDPILAVTRAAGLVSFLEGVPSGPAWLASPHVGQEGNCRRIELASEELEATRLVLVVDDPVAAPLDACLEASFSAWPAGLTEVAVVDYPFGEPTRQGDVVRVYAVR